MSTTHVRLAFRRDYSKAVNFCRCSKSSPTSCESWHLLLTHNSDPANKSSVLPVSYPSSFFQQLLIFPSRICLVAFYASAPVAFISASMQWPKNHTEFLNGHACPAEKITSPTRSVHEGRPEQPHIEILTLGVLPAYQQKGLARHLIHRVCHHFRDSSNTSRDIDAGTLIHANVDTSNVSALTFYERMGMRISSDVIRNMYRAYSYGCRDGYLVVGSFSVAQ